MKELNVKTLLDTLEFPSCIIKLKDFGEKEEDPCIFETLYWNECSFSIFTIPEYLGKPMKEFPFHIPSTSSFHSLVKKFFVSKEKIVFDHFFMDHSGSVHSFHLDFFPFENNQGIVYFRKKTIESFEHCPKSGIPDEWKFIFNFLSFSKFFVWTSNIEGLCDYACENFVKLTGNPGIGTQWSETIHPQDKVKVFSEWVDFVKNPSRDSLEIQYRIRMIDSTYRWFMIRVNPIRDNDKNVIKYIGIGIDVDKRKKLEDELNKYKAKFQALYSSNLIGIVLDSPNGEIFNVNHQMTQMTKCLPEDFEGSSWSRWISPKGKKVCKDRQESLFNKGNWGPIELTLKTKNGKLLSAMIGSIFIHETRDSLSFVMDITDRKQAEIAALEAVRTKSFFIANISHEIRTPLNGICGVTELLNTTPLNKLQKEFVEILKNSSEILLSLINDILDFSKMETGHLRLTNEPLTIQSIVEDIYNILGETAKFKNIQLLSVCKDKWELKGDSSRLKQILLNLVNNAIKFTDEGFVLIKSWMEEHFQDKNQVIVHFEIIDTGIGITEEGKRILFRPFSQIDNTSSRKHQGTGLGLAICKQLVSLYGGSIDLESKLGEGSKFSFFIRVEKLKPISDQSQPLEGNHFILLDSKETRSWVLRQYLEDWNVKFSMTSTPEDILDILQSKKGEVSKFILITWNKEIITALSQILKHKPPTFKIVFIGNSMKETQFSNWIDEIVLNPFHKTKVFQKLFKIVQNCSNKQEQQSIQVESQAPLRNTIILVAEDNPINQKVILRQLERLGYPAVLASNGIEVLNLLKESKNNFALILMDCQMPICSGFDCTKEIRKKEQGTSEHIPIVAMTANALDESASDCFKVGMDDYISKPVSLEDLQSKLEKWVLKNEGNMAHQN